MKYLFPLRLPRFRAAFRHLPLLLLSLTACISREPGEGRPSPPPPVTETIELVPTGDHSTPASAQAAATVALEPAAASLDGVSSSTAGISIGYPEHRVDGNRVAQGMGRMPAAEPLNIPLAGIPAWLAAAQAGKGSIWAVILRDGTTQAFFLQDNWAEPIPVSPDQLPLDSPPVLLVDGLDAELIGALGGSGSPNSRPAVLSLSPLETASVQQNGDLLFSNRGAGEPLSLDALPDGRPLLDGAGGMLILTGPSDRYAHGVLGDQLEATGIALIELAPRPSLVRVIEIGEPRVIEGIAPIWADLNGDGSREIIVTESDREQGARLVVYDGTGERVAQGAPIGLGFRWRHQIAVAPFGPHGELELAVVRTPHIGGVVEFYRLSGANLEIVAELRGFRSHLLGSRNLDMGLAGDFDGDGRVELLLPDQATTNLGGVARTEEGAELAWWVPIGGRLTSNLAAATHRDGTMVVGAGHDGAILRLWVGTE